MSASGFSDALDTLNLDFRKHWFGAQNGNIGGVGSRVFDVCCNGSTLLKSFDILRVSGEIYFPPVVNYPLVNAIEVIPK